jgi:hypothetical protein
MVKKKKLSTFSFETVRSVEDFIDDKYPDEEIAFDDAANVPEKLIIKFAKEDLKDMGIKLSKDIKFVDAKFVEFDSGNISHAGDYYEVTVKGPKEKIIQFETDYMDKLQLDKLQ